MAQEQDLRCEEHSRVLSLFCEDDGELVSSLCAQGPAHQGHHVSPEAAAECIKWLLGYMNSLEEKLKQTEELKKIEVHSIHNLEAATQSLEEQSKSKFQELNFALNDELWAARQLLDKDRSWLEKTLNQYRNTYKAPKSLLQGVVVEVLKSGESEGFEQRLWQTLQQCYESVKALGEPPLLRLQAGFILPPLCSMLDAVIEKFRVPVSLDPQVAHPHLRVSEDLKSVKYDPRGPAGTVQDGPWGDAAELAVLGREGFASGRHYWEVQVGDKPEWAVGVCGDDPGSEAQWPWAGPKTCWTIQLQGGDYQAESSVGVRLTLKDKPTGIGVYLDCDLGHVSFYDLRDRSHLHSFTGTFAEVLKPYFRVGRDGAPLTVGTGSA